MAKLGSIRISLRTFIWIGALCLSVQAQAPADIRIALVIGNAAYPGAPLLNPINDSRDMANTLRSLGFDVIELKNAQRQQMNQAIAAIQEKLSGKRGVGMLYYAGHGLQYDWQNFMVPVDARLKVESDIPAQTVGISSMLAAFKSAGNRLNILVLDACRDNPFDNTLATKGLAPVDAPMGTFIAYATTAGNVADDGDKTSGNGLYTQFLLQEMKKPVARLEDVFKRVKIQVRQHSLGQQIPMDSSNLSETFSFDRGFSSMGAETEAVILARYAAEKDTWKQIQASQDVNVFFDFLQKYPNGFLSEIAQFRADQLKNPVLIAQLAPNAVAALPSGVRRFERGDEYTWVITDRLSKQTRREKQTVTFADDARVEINGGDTVYNQMGGLVKDDSGIKDPAMLLVPSDIALGKRWRSVFKNKYAEFNVEVLMEFNTIAFEEIEVAGKRIKVFRAEMRGVGPSVYIKGTVWIDPSIMMLSRYEREVRIGGRLLGDSTQIEMIDYKPAKRS